MSFAYFTHPTSLQHEMGAQHPECPDRVRVIDDFLRASGLLDFARLEIAPAASREVILRAHGAALLATLEARSPSTGYADIDGDTTMNPYTLSAALHAAGAAVAATDLVCSGRVQRAFCNIRPPGHHAERDQAMGFCFLNNAAIAVLHAIRAHGLQRVAIIDFDVHHGNGSEEILREECDAGRVLMASTFQYPLYPGSGTNPLSATSVNVPLAAYSKGEAMRAAVIEQWLPALDKFAPQLIVISAGFDAHRDDELAMLGWVESDYRWVTQQLVAVSERHCQGRIVSTLEGGYALGALARSVGEHVKVLIGAD
ncbi:MAG: histone deacetylase family protein [Betaproteobacteria bacterium]|nr:MAG: histone deacetylase family protein [Betaproteobacteria bacterium]TAG50277.1 MAG: histone deacetylase family protein [Betaproteobacteria bacterium]